MLNRSIPTQNSELRTQNSSLGLAENLARELANHPAIGAALELLYQRGHNLSHIRHAAGAQLADRRFHLWSQLIGGQLARQVSLQNRRLGLLLLSQVFPATLPVQLDRIAPALELFGKCF